MIIDYDYLAEEFTKCYKDKSRIYMIQNYLKTFDNTQRKEMIGRPTQWLSNVDVANCHVAKFAHHELIPFPKVSQRELTRS